jgi:SH3-like domain-containing protein
VKSAPDDSSTDLFQLHEGTKVEILDKVENYWKVKIADGRVGWMLRDEATTI